MKLTLALAAAMMISVPSLAETLTPETIIALNQAGIGDEAIIAKIKASGSKFDLSTDQMIALKKGGLSGPVIAAMLTTGDSASAPVMSLDSADPMVPHPSGVYLLTEDQTTPKMNRIDATVTNQAKTGGIIGYALTGGIASMSVKAAIQNESARVKSGSPKPTFFFFFDGSNSSGGQQAGTWASGTAATVTTPSEFTLIRLMKKDGRREARVGSMNIGGAKSGVMDKDRIPFDYQMVRPGVFRAVPTIALPKGEYGFIYSINGGGTAGAMNARVFDFAVQ